MTEEQAHMVRDMLRALGDCAEELKDDRISLGDNSGGEFFMRVEMLMKKAYDRI